MLRGASLGRSPLSSKKNDISREFPTPLHWIFDPLKFKEVTSSASFYSQWWGQEGFAVIFRGKSAEGRRFYFLPINDIFIKNIANFSFLNRTVNKFSSGHVGIPIREDFDSAPDWVQLYRNAINLSSRQDSFQTKSNFTQSYDCEIIPEMLLKDFGVIKNQISEGLFLIYFAMRRDSIPRIDKKHLKGHYIR